MGIPSRKFAGRIAAVAVAAAAVAAPFAPTAQASQGTAPHPAWKTWQTSAQDAKADRAFFQAVLAVAKKKQLAHPELDQVTVTYDNQAPTFSTSIANSTRIWNGAVHNVQLQESGGGGDFSYYEGNDPRGSYADTDGHGHGYIFLDYAQNQEYDSTRVAAHETGHALGLPDHYEGPCSELMSGGGPGPSCTNSQPDANERAQVDQLWANGLAKVSASLMR
ncbi:snapalysin [Actinomadura barringtoniae]|uniref:Extracellular small neutral protease n=1 Tax=Actinomadura barringtoniae TaxID=1427535 RepID=A0A939PBY3_9ACTN|nr:snapalysin [Actinomadura barringtoniae]MBO2445666.1 snapalysin [Actinomadura barringtoniae]